MKKFFKVITFRGSYGWLPTVVFFWYSFFFLVTVQILGPFAIIDNWLIVRLAYPGIALFYFFESQFDQLLAGSEILSDFFYATPVRSFLIIFPLTLFSVLLLNFATIRLVRGIRSRSVSRKNPPVSP